MVQHGGGDALRAQHAADDLPVAAEAGNDDRRVLRLADLVELRRVATGIARQQQLSTATSSSGPSSIDSATAPTSSEEVSGGEHAGARGGLEHDEGELAALRQQQR